MRALGLFCLAMGALSLGSLAIARAQAAGKPQVTLLISLDPDYYPKGISALFHDYQQYPEKLERTFRRAFQNSGFDVQVLQGADRFELYEALMNSPDTVAVYWVSHEAPIAWSKDPGIEINPLLVDENRADVKSVFTEMSPKIRWVSLIACDSDEVIHWMGPQKVSTFQGFDHEIDAERGLKEAIQLSLPTLRSASAQSQDSSCISRVGLPVFVKREGSAVGAEGPLFFPSVTIEHNGAVLGALPEMQLKPGERQTEEQEIFLDPPASGMWSAGDLELVAQTGLDPAALPKGFALGSFSAMAMWKQADWKPFAQPDGTPFGVTEEVLLYDGAGLPDSMDLASYHPFLCE